MRTAVSGSTVSRTAEDIIAILERQEKALRFHAISLSSLSDLGWMMIGKAREMGASVYVQIRIAGDTVFASATDGATRNNIMWARRKANTAEMSGQSSMLNGLINRMKGRSLEQRGLSSLDYTEEGGSFPILLSSAAVIGSVTVSGLRSEEDHQLAASSIAHFLGIEIESIL